MARCHLASSVGHGNGSVLFPSSVWLCPLYTALQVRWRGGGVRARDATHDLDLIGWRSGHVCDSALCTEFANSSATGIEFSPVMNLNTPRAV